MTIGFNNTGMGQDSYGILRRSAGRFLAARELSLAPEGERADYTVTLAVNADYKNDRYTITAGKGGAVLTAARDLDLHAALGRLLTESFFDGRGGFVPYEGELDFTPKCPVRGMYFATHWHNFYESASYEEVYEIVEDLALRGCNVLIVWFDMAFYDSMEDEAARLHVDRLHAILRYANRIGMGGGMTMNSNEGFHSSPVHLRAQWDAQGRYHTVPHSHKHLEICPSLPGGIEEILRERREVLSRFTDIDLRYVFYWPYDEGGCTCMNCQPWGSNGFVKLFPHFRDLIREMFPRARIVVSTWYFDRFVDGEWDEFYPRLSDGTFDGVPYFLSFFHNGKLPECIEKNGLPEGVRFLDFAEISMHDCRPWGGFGANPLPRFLTRTLEGSGYLYSGGFPYSEGIFEDLNKFVMLSWYSGVYNDPAAAVRAYIRLECGLEGAELDELTDAVIRTETGLKRTYHYTDKEPELESDRYPIEDGSEAAAVRAVLEKYDGIVAPGLRREWKFRLLLLRARFDDELVRCEGYPKRSALCQELIAEINTINHVAEERSGRWLLVRPGK